MPWDWGRKFYRLEIRGRLSIGLPWGLPLTHIDIDIYNGNHNINGPLRLSYSRKNREARQRQYYIDQKYYIGTQVSIHRCCIGPSFQQDQTNSNHMLAPMQKVPSVTAVPSINSCSSSLLIPARHIWEKTGLPALVAMRALV